MMPKERKSKLVHLCPGTRISPPERLTSISIEPTGNQSGGRFFVPDAGWRNKLYESAVVRLEFETLAVSRWSVTSSVIREAIGKPVSIALAGMLTITNNSDVIDWLKEWNGGDIGGER